MNNNNEPIQLGLLPNLDVPISYLQQRQRLKKTSTGVQKTDFSKGTQEQVRLNQVTKEMAAEKQSQPDVILAQLSSVWERSQEFEIDVEGQSVRVNFRAFYFRRGSNSSGVHHFEFHGHISSTGYRSDFLQGQQAVSWSSPVAYATHKAQELHQELLKDKQQRVTRGRTKNV